MTENTHVDAVREVPEDKEVILYMPIPEIQDNKSWTYDEAAYKRGEGLCAKEMSPILDASLDLTEARVVFIIGGPGSGKSTLAVMLASQYQAIHIMPEDIIRRLKIYGPYEAWKMIQDQKTIGAGDLPSRWVCLLLQMEIRKHMEAGADRFLIEGFPSTVEEFEDFSEIFPKTLAVGLHVSADTMEKRYMDIEMTFDYGQRRLLQFQTLKMNFYQHELALAIHPLFGKQTVWVNGERSPLHILTTLRGVLDNMLLGIGPQAVFAQDGASRILVDKSSPEEISSKEETDNSWGNAGDQDTDETEVDGEAGMIAIPVN